MNEVEKMYENAGIEKYYCSFESSDGNVYNWELNEDGDEKYNKCFIGKPKIKQRSFTAEKQIELIKWLGKSKNGFGLFNDGTEGLSCHCDFNWEWFRKDFYAEDFNNALAGLVNTLWQGLTEEERKQIKNILESEVRE